MQNEDTKAFHLHLLRQFVCAAEVGNLSAAAAAMGIAQSALSRQIAQFETLVCGAVFYRTGRGVELTELGAALMPRAQDLLAQADEFLREAAAVRSTPSGTVSVGIVPSFVRPLAGRLYKAVKEKYPEVRLRIYEAYSGDMQVLLSEGKVQIGILNRYGQAAPLDGDALLTTRLSVVCRRGLLPDTMREIRLSELARLPLAIHAKPNSLRELLEDIARKQGFALDIAIEVASSDAIRDVVLSNDLCCVLVPHAVLEELRSDTIQMHPLCDPVIWQATYIETVHAKNKSRAARAVLTVLSDLFESLRCEIASYNEQWSGLQRGSRG